MTVFNPFNIPSESRSNSQSGISQFDELMCGPKLEGVELPRSHPFAFTIQTVTDKNVIAILMADTVDPWEK